MLDDTLVVWGGEFGRTPMVQLTGARGRDHHIKGFTMWLAGGGVKRAYPTAQPMNSAIRLSTTSFTFATCTPRCCNCWASITVGLISLPRSQHEADWSEKTRVVKDILA